MSYDPRLAARPYGVPDDDYDGGARKGSVRAARERLQAAKVQDQLPDRSRIRGLPSRPNQLVSQYSSQPRSRQQDEDLTPPDSRGNGNLLSPTPQWPLANDADEVLDSRPGPRSPNRGPPPQRPPRPVSDDLPIQQPTSPNYLQPQSPNFLQPPSPNYRGSSYSDDMFSPTSARSSRPLTTSSAASEASSLGEIPDFPVPQPPMPTVQPLPRRNPTLGPPPSSRRGPSSYYTQMSYVSPITEESETHSDIIRSHHGSFASSNVFPINTGDYYLDDDGMRSDDGDTITSDRGMGSRASDHDDQSGLVQQPALVRQASLGRRTKPSLMTIKSVDSFGEKKGGSAKTKSAAVGAAGISSAMLAARDGIGGRGSPAPPSVTLSTGTGLLDPSSDSADSFDEKSRPEDPEKAELALYSGVGKTSFSDRVGKRRPPRIDVDAVREAEARGSLTSLPELIRRATRLAANLDRGKTASRLGLDFWEAGAPEKGMRKSGSLSDMLAAFPPPGEATPARSTTPNANRMSKWPSTGVRDGLTDSAMSDNKSKRRRRCCGMPMWTFVTLLIVLLFLIAAAVIIPIVLIVLPRMRDTRDAAQSNNGNGNGNGDNNTTPPTAVPTAGGGQNNQCNGIITCQNDGVAIFNSDRSCNCVCINGFTGRTCGTAGDAGCTTTNIPGTANNATVGSGIPRLLQTATDDFNVPLDSQRLLSLFSTEALSCTAENALITFNGLASRSIRSQFLPIIVERSIEPSKTLPFVDLEQRQAIGAPGDAVNQNNQNTVATTSAAPEPTSTQPISSDVNALDYARIGVLFAFQETGELDVAARAQQSIQTFLTNERNGNTNSKTVTVGPFTMDLANFTIKFQNGTTISGREGS